MHIGFQKSGSGHGRGEYEVAGSHSGFNAIGLEEWHFSLRWPDGLVRDTGLVLEPGDSGKPRLRSEFDDKYQIGRMVAAMLMLPDPRREPDKTADSLPIVRSKGYVLSRIGFGPNTEFDAVTDLVTIDPSFVNVTNLADTESIGIEKRWARINSIYAASDQFPTSVRNEIERHRAFLASGDPVTVDLTKIVTQLCKRIAEEFPSYDRTEDPLPALEQVLGVQPADGPTLPSPDQLGEDEPEVSARSAHQYRLAKVRGPGHRLFSLAVRQAYGHRCAFCGGKYGAVAGIRSGLEAAHIVAWSKYDADELPNGMSLCKTHHWAFDAGLMMPQYDGGTFRLRFTRLSEQFEPDSMSLLGKDGFTIPDEWLPGDSTMRPKKQYLELLYEDLAVEFVA